VLQFNLEPRFELVTRERSGTLGQDNGPCHGGSLPCARYDFPAHHAAAVSAALSWISSDAALRLEIRCSGEVVATQETPASGISTTLTVEAPKGQICEVRILHVTGPEQRWFLEVTHPN
jgi:hypothetical protein